MVLAPILPPRSLATHLVSCYASPVILPLLAILNCQRFPQATEQRPELPPPPLPLPSYGISDKCCSSTSQWVSISILPQSHHHHLISYDSLCEYLSLTPIPSPSQHSDFDKSLGQDLFSPFYR